tara:strand:+ start:1131 stop:1433 length:303 start_codon:yes stop_codon:yes gene_type:complete
MKKTINYYDFRTEFRAFGREEQFTRQGLKALFDYLEELGDDCGEEIELDVIALCCEFVEYDSLEDFHSEYDKDDYPTLEVLRDHTQVIEIDNESFIIAAF